MRREVGIESLQERRLNTRLSLFSRCIAEGIELSFQYDLKKKHNTRQATNTYAPYIRSNAHYYSFWPRTTEIVGSEFTYLRILLLLQIVTF